MEIILGATIFLILMDMFIPAIRKTKMEASIGGVCLKSNQIVPLES
jgi:hypothetical protein